jgi:hypothetical protein
MTVRADANTAVAVRAKFASGAAPDASPLSGGKR